jgi:glycosyltransferase involved in cell wall biosynthesis
MPDKKLVVIGNGPNFASTKAIAKNNVTMLGFQRSDVLRQYRQRAQGFVFAAEEDFGICAAEAQACGTPVLADGKGVMLEIVRDLSADEPTGLFFEEQTPESIIQAVRRFEKNTNGLTPKPAGGTSFASRKERFCREFREFGESAMARSRARMKLPSDRNLFIDFAAGSCNA